MRYLGALLALSALALVRCGSSSHDAPPPLGNDGGSGNGSADGGDAASTTDGATDDAASDAASDAGADADAGPFDPSKLPGLVVWLDGTKGIVEDTTTPGRVKKWLDQSGHFHDATGVANGNGLPTIDVAAIHGNTAVLCQNQSLMTIDDAAELNFGTGDWGMAFVAKYTYQNGTAGPPIWEKTSKLDVQITGAPTLQIVAGGATAAVTVPTTGQFVLMSARGAKLEARAAGNVATGGTETVTTSEPGPVISICVSANGYSIEMAELVVVNTTLSDADLTKTTDYLKAKYGL